MGLVLAILVLGPLALGAVRPVEFGLLAWLTVGVMLLWGARLWLSPRPKLLWTPVCWAVLAFAGYAVARYFMADIEYVARHELMRVAVYTFLFFAVLNNLHGQDSVRTITVTLVFLGMLISVYAVYQFLTGAPSVWWFVSPPHIRRFASLYPHRATGTYICPNHLAGLLEMLLPLGLAYAVTSRASHVWRIVVGYAALVTLAGIGVTVSRGAWAATAIALLLFFGVLLFQRRYRLPAIVLFVLLLGAGGYFLPRSTAVQARLSEVWNQKGGLNDDLRFSLWKPAWQMWLDHPWIGVGPAEFDPRFRAYRPERVQASPERVHNDYLNTLVDWGVVGTVLVAGAWALLGWGLVKTWRAVRLSNSALGRNAGSNKFAFVLGASLGLAALLAHSATDFNFSIPANAILAVTLMALLSSHLRFVTERFWVTARPWSQGLLTVVLVASGVWLVRESWRGAAEFVWQQRANAAPAFSPDQVALLKRAWAVDSANPETAFAIGEAYRHQSQEGGEFYAGQEGTDYRQLATNAMSWFTLGMKLNAWDSRNYAGYGWCLDWLDRSAESGPYFVRAEQLDPNNYFNLNQIALHYVQLGDYAAAIPWFQRSLRLEWENNAVAQSYLKVARERLMEGATNTWSVERAAGSVPGQ